MYRIFIKSNVMYNFAGEKIYAIAVEIKVARYQAQKNNGFAKISVSTK